MDENKMPRIPTLSLSWFSHGREGSLSLLYGHPEVNSFAQSLLARPLSQGYGVTVLDAGNSFDPYLISRMAQSLGREPREFLSKILVSRSFTCHQTHALIQEVANLHAKRSRLILVLGCLTTFYDEEISLAERAALLRKTLMLLKKSARSGAGIFITSTDSPVPVRDGLTNLLIRAADRAARLDLHQDGSFSIDLIKGINAAGSLKR